MGTNDNFKNATIRKRANVYFDGNVTSRHIETADGVEKTLGIMRPGEYTFETDDEEEIEILAGRVTINVDGDTNTYESGDVFVIPANTEFDLDVHNLVDYCCTYR